LLSDPHTALAVGTVSVLGVEWLRGSATVATGPTWPLIQAGIAGIALYVAFIRRNKLKLVAVLVLGLAFQLAWIWVHLHLGVHGDYDPNGLYRHEGHALLSGHYPNSPYPPGAVALFTFETWIGGGVARVSNALVMVPFQLLCVAAIWALRTRWSAWWATVVALWPLNAYFWEFRFDLVPAAALVVGLLLAYRGHWFGAGLVLGLGAVVKWTPGLSALALLLWLVWSGRRRLAAACALGFLAPLVVANVPLFILGRSALFSPYRMQYKRTMTAESLPYLVLRLFGKARVHHYFWCPAIASGLADSTAKVVQEIAVLLAIALVVLVRNRSSAIALAAMVPVVFLLSNRVFSPQYFVVILAAWAVGAALVVRGGWKTLALTALCAAATTANAILYPGLAERVNQVHGWTLALAGSFVPAVLVTLCLVFCALRQQKDADEVMSGAKLHPQPGESPAGV
jgi:hypothetical protein